MQEFEKLRRIKFGSLRRNLFLGVKILSEEAYQHKDSPNGFFGASWSI